MAVSAIAFAPKAAWAADGAPAVTYTVKIDGRVYSTNYVSGRHIDVTKDAKVAEIMKAHSVSANKVQKVSAPSNIKLVKLFYGGREIALSGAGKSTVNIECSLLGSQPLTFTDVIIEAKQNPRSASSAASGSVFKAQDDGDDQNQNGQDDQGGQDGQNNQNGQDDQNGQGDQGDQNANTFTIKYEANGGEGTMEDQTVNEGDKATLTKNAFTKAGYEFDGWKDADGNDYTDEQADIEVTADLTLTAQWKAITYKVKFDANEGTGTMADEDFTYDEEKALTKNAYTRDGYDFKEWNTDAEGKGEKYTDEQKVKNLTDAKDGVVTLFAQWEKKPAEKSYVTFDANGGTGTMDKQEFVKDQVDPKDGKMYGEANLNENKFTRDGYNFVEWNTKADGSGTKVSDKAKVKVKSDTTLYAQWSEEEPIVVKISVTFDANGGSGTMATQSIDKGATATLNANKFTRSGYTFTGWNTKADGSGTSYANKASFSADADTILYAQWKQNTVKLTFVANGGTGKMDAIEAEPGTEVTLPACTMTRSGYTFTGWNTAANGTGTAVADKATVKLNKDTRLYAQWKKNTTTATTGSTSSTDALKAGSLAKTNDPTPVNTIIIVAIVGAALAGAGYYFNKKRG